MSDADLPCNSVRVLPCESISIAVEPQHRAVVLLLHSEEVESGGYGAPAIMLGEKSIVAVISQLQDCLRSLRLLPLSPGAL